MSIFYPLTEVDVGAGEAIPANTLAMLGYPTIWWRDDLGEDHFWPLPADDIEILYSAARAPVGFIVRPV